MKKLIMMMMAACNGARPTGAKSAKRAKGMKSSTVISGLLLSLLKLHVCIYDLRKMPLLMFSRVQSGEERYQCNEMWRARLYMSLQWSFYRSHDIVPWRKLSKDLKKGVFNRINRALDKQERKHGFWFDEQNFAFSCQTHPLQVENKTHEQR